MDEQFLHYIWKHQKFEPSELKLACGQTLKVFYPGNHNHDSGPDFEEARIKIDHIEWAGQVEIHINSSDWLHHNHQKDKAYENVILHVVWHHDKEIRINDEQLPVLELKKLVDPLLSGKYQHYIKSPEDILCANQIGSLPSLKISSMLDRTLIERLSEKSLRILTQLNKNTNDWEQVTYRVLGANFGFSTNKEAFVRLTELLPYEKLKKVLQNQKSTEALLFGQAGFLEEEGDAYSNDLKSEFIFLRKKFQLQEPLIKAQWRFGKLRPANFPSVRLAQLSSLMHHHPQLFSFLIKTESIKELKKELLGTVSTYWQTHYNFAKTRKKPTMTMGVSSFENILINTIAPMLAAYSKYTDEQKYMDRAIELLESLPSESNRIIKKWETCNINPESAFGSQALIQLYKEYCSKRQCLQCNIGVEILNK